MWARVNRHDRCPICDHSTWCAISPDGTVVKCMRVSDGAFKTREDGSGFASFHKLVNYGSAIRMPSHRPLRQPQAKLPMAQVTRLALEYRNGARLDQLSTQIGISVPSLERLWAGWDGRAWTFPMRDGRDRIIGIRRRLPNGKKYTLDGTCNGLFIPDDVLASEGPLYITEGPTDVGAMLDMGLPAIGRPSCSGGTDFIKAILKAKRHDAVVVADNDTPRADGRRPGQDGALALALAVKHMTRSMRIIKPPRHKDIRQWYLAGCTADAIKVLALNARRIA